MWFYNATIIVRKHKRQVQESNHNSAKGPKSNKGAEKNVWIFNTIEKTELKKDRIVENPQTNRRCRKLYPVIAFSCYQLFILPSASSQPEPKRSWELQLHLGLAFPLNVLNPVSSAVFLSSRCSVEEVIRFSLVSLCVFLAIWLSLESFLLLSPLPRAATRGRISLSWQ